MLVTITSATTITSPPRPACRIACRPACSCRGSTAATAIAGHPVAAAS
eukprot:COSAG01_NODE_75956_length_191_cov_45.902174_1_plen_47_part_01